MPTEFTTTRSNPGVDPVLNAWLVEVPIDLFAAALAAGLMIAAGIHLLLSRPSKPEPMVTCTIGPIIGVGLLGLGLTALFLDLSHKLYVWRLYLTFQPTAPMSWGSYIMPLSAATLLLTALAFLPASIPVLTTRFPWLRAIGTAIFFRPGRVLALGATNVGLGLALGVYTGTLLSTLQARPLWNSPLLGVLFLTSGLATALALLHAILVVAGPEGRSPAWAQGLTARLGRWTDGPRPDSSIAPVLRWGSAALLAAQLGLIALYLVGMLTATEVSQRAVTLLISGRWALPFWVLVVAVGTFLPLAWQLLEIGRKVRCTVLPALLVLLGGFALRYIFVFAGQESHWLQGVTAGF